MRNKPFWEESYNRPDSIDTFAGGKPSQEIQDLVPQLPRGAKVLVLACGEGRNAVFLAENGFDVTAVDISAAGINKVRSIAKERGLVIKTEIQDMRKYVFEATYDLITVIGSPHLVEREYGTELIHKIQAHTNDHGYNVISVFTARIPPPEDIKEFTVGLFREGELFEFYRDWRAVLQQSRIFEDEHPGVEKHEHAMDKVVAQKMK